MPAHRSDIYSYLTKMFRLPFHLCLVLARKLGQAELLAIYFLLCSPGCVLLRLFPASVKGLLMVMATPLLLSSNPIVDRVVTILSQQVPTQHVNLKSHPV